MRNTSKTTEGQLNQSDGSFLQRKVQCTLQPRVCADLVDVRTTFWIRVQTAQHELLRRFGHVGSGVHGKQDAPGDGVAFGWERRGTSEEIREEDAQSPDLCRRCAVRLLLQHLRCGIGSRAKEEGVPWARLRRVHDDRAAKINEFDLQGVPVSSSECEEKNRRARGATKTYVEIAIDEDVFVLDITVRDALTVEVVDGVDNLSEHETSLPLREAFVLCLLDAFKEIMRRSAEERRL